MNEQWREFAPNYEVSDAGRVRRSADGRKTFCGRIMKLQQQRVGYLSVNPTVDGKNVQFYVHDAVALAFIGPKPAGASVNHIDGDKMNNTASNLEYVSHAENMRHASESGLMVHGAAHPAAKLNDDAVRSLRADRVAGLSFSRLARKYGISIATAFYAANGTNWKHIA